MNDLFIQGLTIDWNRVRPYNYVRQIPAISGIDTFTFHKPITFFVGENGSGKSTLLEAIAVAYGFNAEGGTKNYSFSTYNSHSELCEAMTISKGYRRPKFGYFLRAESFYNVFPEPVGPIMSIFDFSISTPSKLFELCFAVVFSSSDLCLLSAMTRL